MAQETTTLTPTPTVNQPAASLNSDVGIVVHKAEQLADAALEAQLAAIAPWTNLPVIHQLADFTIETLVSLIGDKISIGLQQVGTFIVIDTQIASEKQGISQALANLLIAEKAGDKNEIQLAIVAYQKAQSALINSDGAAPIHT